MPGSASEPTVARMFVDGQGGVDEVVVELYTCRHRARVYHGPHSAQDLPGPQCRTEDELRRYADNIGNQ